MTIPDSDVLDAPLENTHQRTIPTIMHEEDVPFPVNVDGTSAMPTKPVDKKLNETDDLDKEITRFRFATGRTVLYIAMSAMGIMVLLDLIVSHFWAVERDLIGSAFEAFKLITMTVLGYIFGSSGSNGTNTSK